MIKRFRIPGDQIRVVAPRRGSCVASDRITVGGERVGFMYREEPRDKIDSGWTFLAGTESQEYLDDPHNLEIYDVNTIANYDADIVPLLDSPVGSAFERSEAGRLVAVQPPTNE